MIVNHLSKTETTAGWRPLVLRPSVSDERRALHQLLAGAEQSCEVFDTVLLQLRDLLRTRRPGVTLADDEVDVLIEAHLNGGDLGEYGAWIYYPWTRRLVHLLDQSEFVELRTNRNRHKITQSEQDALATKRVGVVGLSVGHAVAVTLALERSCGELRLADFDTLDLSNLNRIRAGVHGLGLPKSVLTARDIAELDPYLTVTVFGDGLTADNIDAFFLDGGSLDLVVEECDSLDIKVLVRHRARAHRIAVVMGTSDRGMLDIERFDLEPDRPLFHGWAGDIETQHLSSLTIEQKIPYVLRLLPAETMSPRLRASMLEIDQTITTWPQLGSAVAHGGAVVADAVRRINLQQASRSGRFFAAPDPDAAISVQAAGGPVRTEAVAGPPCCDPLIRDLVLQATSAPSGGNVQPWRWIADEQHLHLALDRSRASFMDVGFSGSYVALGCAAETLILAAHAARLEVNLRLFPADQDPDCVATFELTPHAAPDAEPHWRDELHAFIPMRCTRRVFSERQSIDDQDLQPLTDAVRSVNSCAVQWLVDEASLAEIGALAGMADRLRMTHREAHAEMFHELRWTEREAQLARDGIDVRALELPPSDAAGLALCQDWPSVELVRQWGGGLNFEKLARKQIAAASAVGLITTASARPRDYLLAGRAIQRMWLAATEQGLAVHPIATLPYFLARFWASGVEDFDDRTRQELSQIEKRYQRLFTMRPSTGHALLIRIGFRTGTVPRSFRRPLDEVLSLAPQVLDWRDAHDSASLGNGALCQEKPTATPGIIHSGRTE